ncbi:MULTISPECIES: o-succinylbenzoate synthase [unclassified Rhodococcus (in: high G+C Gram-positive bacteria)]|uniref:o-succinylbenzoate synthase n=1 Tax=unclassified Rhodococcus (in: high G+C Gram-positive bacteria) TaxID=192944 RepID=UPI001639B0D4|nr:MULTISPECIES: o-succinylbenzoate synthase [unclassified Rhodococcus (in: high G+C Gram-positive bacteria)]MBC2639362.1 o-succinylbenzoate synthase [Rhodococcus sp. 3A]MBC2895893.1 o-succinylbenzoate synthase [Rhodococcus sp. 4CII]
MTSLPSVAEVLADAVVVSLPMRVRFRGITTREALLLRGPAGWGEFAPFPEYADDEAAHWLQSAIEDAWLGPPAAVRTRVPINATVPAVDADRVPDVLSRYPGARTAKVKVAERGQTLADDVARVTAVRTLVPNVRVDANGGWSVDEAEAALRALTADGPLEYAEQPCASVPELVEIRRRLPGVRVAADESIRRADDPLKVVRAGGADVAVVKVAPLGGMRRLLSLADDLASHGVPVVVSSALDTAVGIAAGVAAAAALPELQFACGLGTGGLFEADVARGREPVDGALTVEAVVPDVERLTGLAASAERSGWWIERARRCHGLLERRGVRFFV